MRATPPRRVSAALLLSCSRTEPLRQIPVCIPHDSLALARALSLLFASLSARSRSTSLCRYASRSLSNSLCRCTSIARISALNGLSIPRSRLFCAICASVFSRCIEACSLAASMALWMYPPAVSQK